MKKILFTGIILTYMATGAMAQCAQVLRQARITYSEGKIHNLPTDLAECLKNGFTSEEKVEAYRLLVLSYIYLDEPEKADEAMLNLLRENPEFVLDEQVEPDEFINLYNQFRTRPIFSVGPKGGFNFTGSNVTERFGVNDIPSEHYVKAGFQIGASFEIPISSKINLNPELYYKTNKIDIQNKLYYNPDGTIVSDNSLIYDYTWVELPVLVQYHLYENNTKKDRKQLNPYVALGASIGYLLNAQVIAYREITSEQPIRENTLDISDAYEKINYNLVGAIGFKSKLKRGFFIFEMRYSHGLKKIFNEKEGVEQLNELYFDYYGSYDQYKLNNFAISAGYVFNIYNPKKLTN